MYVGKKQSSKAKFRIKLLSGNSVILVEADGYDSELFVPHLQNGRIDLHNILPSRRCSNCVDHPRHHKHQQHHQQQEQQRTRTECTSVQSPVVPANSVTNVTASTNTSTNMNIPYTYTTMNQIDHTPRTWRMCAGQDIQLQRANPIANSTPANTCNNNTINNNNNSNRNNMSLNNKENFSPNPSYISHNMSQRVATPQPVRTTMPHGQHEVLNMMKNKFVQIPKGVKVLRLFRSDTPDDELVRSTNAHSTNGNIRYSVVANDIGNGNCNSTPQNVILANPVCSVDGDPSPNTRRSHRRSTRMSKSPIYATYRCSTSRRSPSPGKLSIHLSNSPRISVRRSPHKSTLMCPTQSTLQKIATPKWRKCLTPKFNYSRNAATNVSSGLLRHGSNSSIKQSRIKKVVASFLLNPTQGIKGTHKVELRKRKLIVDSKKTISPQSFKRQQRSSPVRAMPMAAGNKRRLSGRYKTNDNAFDLLTQPSRTQAMSTKLNQQFQKGCINKACSTNPKYKTLCTLPSGSEKDDDIEEFGCRQRNDRVRRSGSQASADCTQSKGVTFYNSSMGAYDERRHGHFP